ncbi:hypothetical protein [Streptoalloteichus hindustanus]|uniref:Uncharacterized protein n=1 Tax=Streptoalloteichus hindustanus TaxID=2017 RepID=A0A1M5EML5_STRHI|nr:hypothetical protein [Streptoalloteichus hindustanus]SHF80528.1 hypothetical protein SAMN05444320_10553 [Streptoalloteichus hindustanus]
MFQATRRTRRLAAVVGAVLAVTATGVPATGAEPRQESKPPECEEGWCPVSLPRDPAPEDITGLAAVADEEVWAVGRSAAGALTLRWDGRAWQNVPTPSVEDVKLRAVAGSARNDVWAVGEQRDPTTRIRTLTQHWDGREWTVVPSPSPADQKNSLSAVAVAGPDDVWAVGETESTGDGRWPENRPLLQRWNGRHWTVVPTPLSEVRASFHTVVVRSPDDVWIGALVGSPFEKRIATALRWDGRSWHRCDVPDKDGVDRVGLGAAPDGRPLLVGVHRYSRNSARTRVWHWTGSEWTKVTVSYLENYNGDFGAPAADGSGRVWLVGGPGGGTGGLFEWDGRRWTAIEPKTGGRGRFAAVTALPGGRVWVGGKFGRTDHNGLVYARRDGSPSAP